MKPQPKSLPPLKTRIVKWLFGDSNDYQQQWGFFFICLVSRSPQDTESSLLIAIFIFITLSERFSWSHLVSGAMRQSKAAHSMANYHIFAFVVFGVVIASDARLGWKLWFRHQVLLRALVGAVFGFSRCAHCETKLNKIWASSEQNQPVNSHCWKLTFWGGSRYAWLDFK